MGAVPLTLACGSSASVSRAGAGGVHFARIRRSGDLLRPLLDRRTLDLRRNCSLRRPRALHRVQVPAAASAPPANAYQTPVPRVIDTSRTQNQCRIAVCSNSRPLAGAGSARRPDRVPRARPASYLARSSGFTSTATTSLSRFIWHSARFFSRGSSCVSGCTSRTASLYASRISPIVASGRIPSSS